jgi:hypothetical protein
MRLLRYLGLALAVSLLASTPSRAVTVTVEPADTTVTVGATFSLRVVSTAFADLKGYQLIHSFDSSRLSLVEILPGDVLTGTGRPYAAYPLADEGAPVDSTWLDAAMLEGNTSAPGVLAYLRFTALELKGDALIQCEHVELRDSNNAWTYPDCVGGVVHVAGPVPVRRPTWGELKSTYR